jgi:putative membrane protein
MLRTTFLTLGAIALAALIDPTRGLARSDEQQMQDDRPSADHGVQGSLDAGMGKMPTMAPEFVAHVARDGIAEVELGKLAVARGASADVKQFGQHMVDDHGKANGELKSLATAKNIPVPSDLTAEQKATKDTLSKLSGADFDRAYMKAMVSDHDKAVAKFRAFSEKGDDADLKKWAEKTLPTLEAHERMAKETATKVSASGKNEPIARVGKGAAN